MKEAPRPGRHCRWSRLRDRETFDGKIEIKADEIALASPAYTILAAIVWKSAMPIRKTGLTSEQDALELNALRLQIKAGIDELERGDFVEIDEAYLEDYLASLGDAGK